MVQVQNLIRQEIASVWVPVLNRSEQPYLKASAGPDRGFYIAFPQPDFYDGNPKRSRIRSLVR